MESLLLARHCVYTFAVDTKTSENQSAVKELSSGHDRKNT